LFFPLLRFDPPDWSASWNTGGVAKKKEFKKNTSESERDGINAAVLHSRQTETKKRGSVKRGRENKNGDCCCGRRRFAPAGRSLSCSTWVPFFPFFFFSFMFRCVKMPWDTLQVMGREKKKKTAGVLQNTKQPFSAPFTLVFFFLFSVCVYQLLPFALALFD
jgi:hypothetical protein